MQFLIVYDSVFGNTKRLAEELAAVLGGKETVSLKNVYQVRADDVESADFCIFASPTRAFAPTPGMKSYIKSLPADSLKGRKTAVFDTRIDAVKVNNWLLNILIKLFGYAAETMAKMLRKKGATESLAEWFYVDDSQGPLRDGELQRLGDWGASILER